MSTAAPPLAPELMAGLRRLKLATIRAQAPEVLQTARTQRWPPEDVLRTLVAAEVAARDQTNQHVRLKAANLPVLKRLDDFDTPGTGKSHVLIGVGLHAVEQGLRVRYGTAADLVEQLYRGLADNTVSRVIDGLLRNDLNLIDEVGFAPLDETGTQLLFRLVAAAYERRSLGLASHWPFEDWGTFLPVPSTAAALLDRLLHHAVVVVTSGESWRLKEARTRAAHRSPPNGATSSTSKEDLPTP